MKPATVISIVWVSVCVAACKDTTSPSAIDLERRLAVGEQVSCALNGVGAVYCWGQGSAFWEYGASPSAFATNGSPRAAVTPPLQQLASGVSPHYCGLAADRSAVCWGRGPTGELGTGLTANGNPAGTVQGGITWSMISVARLTTCGLSDAGAAYCWGINQRGEIGDSAIAIGAFTNAPHPVAGGLTFKTIAAGWYHVCGITTSSDLYCWGSNNSGQLGVGGTDTVGTRMPALVEANTKLVQLSLGSRYTCGLANDGTAYCWGENATGQLGDGTTTAHRAPTLVAGGLKFAQIVSGSGFFDGAFATPPTAVQGGVGHTCALTRAGKAYCWGWNGNGELGDGTTTDRSEPTAVTGGLTFGTIGVGGAHTCAMKGDNVWCWGSRNNGQIGDGPVAPLAVRSPIQVLPPFGPP